MPLGAFVPGGLRFATRLHRWPPMKPPKRTARAPRTPRLVRLREAQSERPRWPAAFLRRRRVGSEDRRQGPNRVDGRSRSSCREASIEADLAQALIEITADHVHVLSARKASFPPRAGACAQGLKLLHLRLLAERAVDGAPDQLRAGGAGGTADAVEELELLVAQVDLRPAHRHHYTPCCCSEPSRVACSSRSSTAVPTSGHGTVETRGSSGSRPAKNAISASPSAGGVAPARAPPEAGTAAARSGTAQPRPGGSRPGASLTF